MNLLKNKIILLLVLGIALLFFSNDFGLIDIEKTAIITAVAIDSAEDGEYVVTTEIAVPEATDTNAENAKAVISGKGSTIGASIKNVGDISGWFPKLSFCNMIIVGSSLSRTNVIKVLDFFAKTLRVQDSAVVILAEKSAKELLETATPLDNISSFALQKILLKDPGFDRDIATTDVRKFCSDYYSDQASSYMPLVKIVEENKGSENTDESGSQGNSGSSGSSAESGGAMDGKGNTLFDATTTALFKNGVKVGELDKNLTTTFNFLFHDVNNTVMQVNDVNDNGTSLNYLITILRCSPEMKLKADENSLQLNISLDLYCRVSDQNADYSDNALSEYNPFPLSVKYKAEKDLKESLEILVLKEIETECDFLRVGKSLYRYNHAFYPTYKDKIYSSLKTVISVNVHGQT